MSNYPVGERQGKGTIAAGVAAVGAGLVLQAVAASTLASPGPMMFGSTGSFGAAALLSGVSGVLILAGIVVTIVGIIRYAQSGQSVAVAAPPAPVRTPAPAASPRFCSSCGARLVGEARFCASCGAPAAH